MGAIGYALQAGRVGVAGGGGEIGTVGGILLFFAGLARVGPTSAAILSTLEPVVTVGSVALVFGETFTAQQVVGAALALGAVAIAQAPVRSVAGNRWSRPGPPDEAHLADCRACPKAT